MHISAIWRQRLLLVGVGIISCGSWLVHHTLSGARIYDIRWAGGLHPSDILYLRWAGDLVGSLPVIILLALVVTFLRPALAGALLIISVALSLVFQLLLLFAALMVILLNVPAPNA